MVCVLYILQLIKRRWIRRISRHWFASSNWLLRRTWMESMNVMNNVMVVSYRKSTMLSRNLWANSSGSWIPRERERERKGDFDLKLIRWFNWLYLAWNHSLENGCLNKLAYPDDLVVSRLVTKSWRISHRKLNVNNARKASFFLFFFLITSSHLWLKLKIP